jgi:hypothetical protein
LWQCKGLLFSYFPYAAETIKVVHGFCKKSTDEIAVYRVFILFGYWFCAAPSDGLSIARFAFTNLSCAQIPMG